MNNYPIIPTDEMSAGERLSALKVLSGTYKPATRENLSHFCDCCANLGSLLVAVVKEITAYSDCVSPEYLYHMYHHLRDNIRRFNHVNQDMIASQYVSIYTDFQEEMNVFLRSLNGIIVDFMALPINTNPDAISQLLSETAEDNSDDEELSLYFAHIYKVLPDVMKQVNAELEQLLMKNQEQYALCRSHRSDNELGLIFNTAQDRYYEEEFPKQRMEEESFITQRMNDTGKSRHTVLQDRYNTVSSDFMKTPEGHTHYSNYGNEKGTIAELMFNKTDYMGYTSYFLAICKMEHLKNEIERQSREDELNAYRERDQKKTKKVTFTCPQNEKMVMQHIHDAIDFLIQKNAKPMEWVCLYQALLFYKLIHPVHFLVFWRWINELAGKEVFSYYSAKNLCASFFVKEAGKVWTETQATKYKDTENMANKVETYNMMVSELIHIIRYGNQ